MVLREINLVPTEILARRHFRRHFSAWVVCLIACLALIFGFHLYQTHVILTKERTLSVLKDVPVHLSLKIEEIKKIQEDLERLTQQQAIIETITKNKPYFMVLMRLAGIMNEYTWLIQLALERAKDDNVIAGMKLTGYSFSNEELGIFINTLSKDQMFNSVVLKFAKEMEMKASLPGEAGPVKVIQFLIECNIVKG